MRIALPKLVGSVLVMALSPGLLWACTGPAPLHLDLVETSPRPQASPCVELQLLPRSMDPGSPGFQALPGELLVGSQDRRVQVDSRAPPGSPFSISSLGPIPDMLLQWGGFDPQDPWASGRRRGYRLEIHQVGPPLPAPAGWTGPWSPESERWYTEAGPLVEDAQIFRWIHRNMGGRFGEEVEPWLKLQKGPTGSPSRLHLWLILDAGFETPEDLWLRFQPATPGAVRTRWSWGDGQVEERLRGSRTTPLEERLHARHCYRSSGPEDGFRVRTELQLDWLFGAWARDGNPWVWEAKVRYLGFVDLEPLAKLLTPAEALELESQVEALRSRLRCLPGDREAPVFTHGDPCSYQASDSPDAFLQPGGAAITELLRAVLPARLRPQAGSLPRSGRSRSHTLRFEFSGSFPQHSAPLEASPEFGRLLGQPGDLRLRLSPDSVPGW